MCQICISETCQKGRTVKHVKKAEHDHAENLNPIAFEFYFIYFIEQFLAVML